MNNIEEILFEAVRIACAGILGGLIGARANDKLARRRDKDSGLAADKKLIFLPIDELIDTTRNCDVPDMVRCSFRSRLYAPYSRFRLHLQGKRLIAYNEAWKKLVGTQSEEVSEKYGGIFDKSNSEELKNIQEMLVGRLETLRKIVRDTKRSKAD